MVAVTSTRVGRAASSVVGAVALALCSFACSVDAGARSDAAPAGPTTSAAPTATGTPTPSSVPTTDTTSGTALAATSRLSVGGRGPKTGYTREEFGQTWFDTDRNGCDTRNDVLRRDLVERTMKNACKVLTGSLAPDPYTGVTVRFVYGGSSEVDVDHAVALSDAWQKGAAQWEPGKRLAFANDPLNLLVADASTNRAKGDGDTATWLPPAASYRCSYVARQVAVKTKYAVRVTPAERDAMVRVLSTCPARALPGPGAAPTVAALPRSRARTSASPQAGAPPAPPTPPEVVHPGSFCAPQGATGVTEAGTAMACSTRAGDDRARWRSR